VTTTLNADNADSDDGVSVWNETKRILRPQVADSVWFATFHDSEAVGGSTMSLLVRVPNAFARDRIQNRYKSLVRDALDQAGAEGRDLQIEVQADDRPREESTTEPTSAFVTPTHGDPSTRTGRTDKAEQRKGVASGLNPRYTFETFVKGTSNQFALAAAQRVAETPGRSYNPLFIYGSAGLGKTHLLQAIGDYVHRNYAHYEVRYVSTETFLNEYVDGIRNNTITSFKRRYREVDVLLIDDIQFMEGKEGLQEEFFHTFNSLHGANKQIVLSSDRMPDSIPTLEDRLRGRFRWGLITDVQPPDLETRLAILRTKADQQASSVSDHVLEFVAAKVSSNIRDLEGALIRLTAYASLTKVPITVTVAEQQLANLFTEVSPKPRTDEELLAEIADHLGFAVADIRGSSRQRPLVMARQMAMYAFRQLTENSYPSIAKLFGGRDHTTVMHACHKVQTLMAERRDVFDRVTTMIDTFKQS